MSAERKKTIVTAEVLSNQQIRKGYYRLILNLSPEDTAPFKDAVPGQFLELDLSNVSLSESSDVPMHLRQFIQKQVLLRRPFSFSDITVTHEAGGYTIKIELLYAVLGPGTVRMMNLKSGDPISILGPLGNGFTIPDNLSHAILIAGGMGAPPILHLASYLKKHQPQCEIFSFIGARSCDDLPFSIRIGNLEGLVLEEFDRIQVPSQIATDDGSAGYRGYVTDCARDWLEHHKINTDKTVIFACGPEPMLASTALLSEDYAVPCQVSMERMMACGIGLCQSCVVQTKTPAKGTGYHLCCKDGPVFDGKDVIFLTE